MLFVGIDQSLRSPGIAAIDDSGRTQVVMNLKNNLRGAERLAFIRDGLMEVLKKYPPEFAALEGYSVNSVNRPFDLGEIGGIVRLCFWDVKAPFIVVTPTQLKKFVTGSGAADKAKVMEWVSKKWSVSFDQDDQADAFGLAQVARVYKTRQTTYRSELEVVHTISDEANKILRLTPAKGRTKTDI
jgi:Holliday junction resolvasome RuvABC endonuclease subunit